MKSRLVPALLAALLAGPLVAQEGASPPKAPQKAKQDKAKQDKAKQVSVKVGTEVPKSLALADINGKPVSFADLRGKTVVIHFWSVICPAEPMAEPKVNKIADDYKDKGVVVLGINANQNEIGAQPTAEDWQGDDKPYGSFRKQAEQKLNHRLLLDHGGNVARTLQARTTPHCFVVSPKGVLVYSGALDANGRSEEGGEPYVRNAIDAVIAGKKVTVAETKPYG